MTRILILTLSILKNDRLKTSYSYTRNYADSGMRRIKHNRPWDIIIIFSGCSGDQKRLLGGFQEIVWLEPILELSDDALAKLEKEFKENGVLQYRQHLLLFVVKK